MLPIPTKLLGYTTAGAAAAALIAGAWGLRVDHLRAGYKSDLADVRKEYGAFKVAIVDKTAQALAAQKAVYDARENELKEKADAADETITGLRVDTRAAVLRYAQSNRSAGGQAGASPTNSHTGFSEAASTATGFPEGIVISMDDALRVADLYSYALSAHRWAGSIEGQGSIKPP